MGQNRVIVIGGNHHNTLGVIRSLGYKGIRPYVILVSERIGEKNYVLKSKYVSDFECFTDYNNLISWLIENRTKLKDSVVICTSDGASSAVDSNYDQLSGYYRLPNALRQGVITHFMNKAVMADLAEKVGLNVPPTILFDYKNPQFGKIEYPCIIKPLLSIEGTKSDIRICKDIEELNQYLKIDRHCSRFQIQKFIDKDFEYQLIGCSIDSGERIIIPGVSNIIRPSKCSNTGFLKYESLNNSYPIEKAKEFLKRIGYSGLFSMEFLRDKSGYDYFMEVNFRNDGNSICVTAAGVNLQYLWYLSCSGNSIDTETISLQKDVLVMPEFDDFINVLKRRLSLFQWIKDVRRTDCFMEYDKTDIKPFLNGMSQQLANYLKLGMKKIFKK